MQRQLPSPRRSSVQLRRRGALFNYYMVYLMMTAAVMAAAGICLHTLLRADQADSVAGWHLQSLLRMERQLRLDASNATTLVVVDGNLICQPDQTGAADEVDAVDSMTWLSERHTVVRKDSVTGRTEHFRLHPGSRVQFLPPVEGDPDSLLVVRIEEPSPHAPVADSRSRSGRSPEATAAPETNTEVATPAKVASADGRTAPFAVEILLRPGSAREVAP